MEKISSDLAAEVEEEVRLGRSDKNSIHNWEARFRERLETTLEQLMDAHSEHDPASN